MAGLLHVVSLLWALPRIIIIVMGVVSVAHTCTVPPSSATLNMAGMDTVGTEKEVVAETRLPLSQEKHQTQLKGAEALVWGLLSQLYSLTNQLLL